MKKQVWKYILSINDSNEIDMPMGAEILCLQMQGDEPCIWALVTPSNERRNRSFKIFGTGFNVYCEPYEELKYVGTIQLPDIGLVFHVFEVLLKV